MTNVPCIYELDPHGEANGVVHFFCSGYCLEIIRADLRVFVSVGTTTDALPGTVCEVCKSEIDVEADR